MKRLHSVERATLVALLLLTWALRWVVLLGAPPGWRDDDLIEVYTFSARILEEGPALYFPGASGHEPLFHTLRAAVVALAGINQASARWLSAVAGLLAALLTWAVGRRIWGRSTGLLAGGLVAVSFWALMYSRVAVRHMGALPWMLLAIYWAWRMLREPQLCRRRQSVAVLGMAAGVAGGLLTYYAGRVMPALLLTAYPLVRPRRRRWRPYLLALVLGGLMAAPMFWAAAGTAGADARVSELAVPIHSLRSGDPRPLLHTTWTTLGMAHARGDPEWLYNLSERPVFGALGAAAFYIALLTALYHWRQPAERLLLLWLAAGIGPAFISLPPSSYGHTILALPAVYLLLATLPSTVTQLPWGLSRRGRRIAGIGVALLLWSLVAARDLPDYFVHWPNHPMVRFLYRANYRDLAHHLEIHDEIQDLAVGSMLFGPWDKVALQTDAPNITARIRWVNPERALVFVGGGPTHLYLQREGARAQPIQALLNRAAPSPPPPGMQGYWVEPAAPSEKAVRHTGAGTPTGAVLFADALALDAVQWVPLEDLDGPFWLATWWSVHAPLPLPPERLIPHPPPPDVYSGPRLAVFAHFEMSSEGEDAEGHASEVVHIDDGLWLDPYSLRPGDRFIQFHRFEAAPSATVPVRCRLGLYDPLTGERWRTPSGDDHLLLHLDAPRLP